jgi:beta-amylase
MMRSFRTEFDDLFAEGLIDAVEIGLGASGELKYPSFSERMGWRYPGIGEFQVPHLLAPFQNSYTIL